MTFDLKEKQGGKVWIGFIWFRIGSSGGFLRTQWSFGFRKGRGIPRFAQRLSDSEKRLCSMKLVLHML